MHGTDRSKWNSQLRLPATFREIERAYVTPGWWGANLWPGLAWPSTCLLNTPTTQVCVTCDEEHLANAPPCAVCDAPKCRACTFTPCSACGVTVCETCFDDDFIECVLCSRHVCSVCAQDWHNNSQAREDEGREDDEYECEACWRK